VHMTQDMFTRSILPIGLLFSASLILSNTAYLYLSVAYIQMLKAFTPVAILLISWTFRIQEPNRKLAVIVFMISSGVALASRGELRFNFIGFITQAAAVAFEASRLVMIQILLHGMKMDPLVSLHYYAPVCALINILVIPFTEGLAPFYAIYEGVSHQYFCLAHLIRWFPRSSRSPGFGQQRSRGVLAERRCCIPSRCRKWSCAHARRRVQGLSNVSHIPRHT
jgi:drug/metabolite transporter (DMT)-like permease